MQSINPLSHRCFRKRRFASQRDANSGMRLAQRRPNFSLTEGETLNVYPCYDCGGWHIGRRLLHPPARKMPAYSGYSCA